MSNEIMDSISNSFDSFLPKIEANIENDRDNFGVTRAWSSENINAENDRDAYRVTRVHWTSENTMKLIEALERDCQDLWNTKLPSYRDKTAKQIKYEYLADMFGTTVEEISRKLHNLRTQYNHELRKLKKKHVEGAPGGSRGWEYFEALSFLKPPAVSESMSDPLEMVESVNIELAKFQAEEEEVFGAARAQPTKSPSPVVPKKQVMRVAASSPALPPQALTWTEQPRIQPGLNADECQIFGDFVASELRTLRSAESRKKLKRMIQKAILEVGEEEDGNMYNS